MELKIGDKAPAFSGVDQHGKIVSLKDFKGSKLVLFFYPKDSTPGCTAQACNLRDNYEALLQEGYAVVGVSADAVKSHQKFATKNSLPYSLIADENQVILNAYGVWGEKKFMGRTFMGIHRTTFLINKMGKIKAIITKPDTKNHTAQVLEAWK